MKHLLQLYKYKPLRASDELSHLEDFLNNKIWMPPLQDLNDPYEGAFKLLAPSYDTVINNPDLFKIILDVHRECGESNLTDAEMLKRLPKFLDDVGKYKGIVFNQFLRFGVFSFTNNCSNIPMWAHYADYHQGYCLIFDVDFSYAFEKLKLSLDEYDRYMRMIMDGKEPLSYTSNEDDFRFLFSKINYKDSIPEIIFEEVLALRDKDDKIKMRFALDYAYGVKFNQWILEGEYRLIVNANCIDHGDKKAMSLERYAPFITVSGLIMGKNLRDKKIVTDMCKEHGINLYQAVYSEREYKIDSVRVS